MQQAQELTGVEYAPNSFFNVVYDINDEPFISKEEQEQCNIEWLKQLKESEFNPIQYEI